MAGPVGSDAYSHEIVVFKVGGLTASLPAGSVEGVIGALDVAPMRALPGGMLGSFQFRGQAGAVADLHWKLGLGAPISGTDHKFLIVAVGRYYAALRVDAVEGRVSVGGSSFEMLSVPGSGEGLGYLRGVVRRGGRNIPLLDPELLVSSAAVQDVVRRAA